MLRSSKSVLPSRFVYRILLALTTATIVLSFLLIILRDLRRAIQTPSTPPVTSQSRYASPNRVLPDHHHNYSVPRKEVLKQAETLIHRPANDTTVLRAILLFYPNDQHQEFQCEFRWFYRSWIEMMTDEPVRWRTDLIIFATEFVPLFQELGCVLNRTRQHSTEPPRCRVFPYIRVKNRHTNHQPASIYQKIDQGLSIRLHYHLKSYGYIDSINTVVEYLASYEMYDTILRSDMDCFLTKNFAHYIPFNQSLLVGYGGYGTAFNNRRLKRIAHDMGWEYADRTSLGSTWYGPPLIAHRIANFTVTAMLHLTINEFSTPEREQRLGVMLWPEWHYGVLLLYGGHLAINHLTVAERYDVGLASDLLDQGVTSVDRHDIQKNVRLHLHCWHGDQRFSKFAFKEGKYSNIDPKTLIGDTSASGYATRLALEANKMSLKELHGLLLNVRKN